MVGLARAEADARLIARRRRLPGDIDAEIQPDPVERALHRGHDARLPGPRGAVQDDDPSCLHGGQSPGSLAASHAFATRFWARLSQASTTRSRSSSRDSLSRSGIRTRTAGYPLKCGVVK